MICASLLFVTIFNIVTDTNAKSLLGDPVLLKNKTLCVTTMPSPPFSNVSADKEFTGVVIEILDRISNKLGFRYNVVLPQDRQYGVQLANGSFTGMAGMLQRQECDIIATDFSITYVRSQILDFASYPFYYDNVGIMIAAPKHVSLKLWTWSHPFSWSLWLCFISALLLVSICLYIGHAFCIKETWTAKKFTKLNDCVSYVGAAYVSQGFDIYPKSWWGHVLLTCWWLLCIVEVASYSSFLISVLTAPPVAQLPFKDLSELARLVDKKEYKICVLGGTSVWQAIQSDEKEEYHLLKKWLSKNPKYVAPNMDACMNLMISDATVALVAETIGLRAQQHKLCQKRKFVILPYRFFPSMYSLAFQKNFSHTSLFSSIIMEMADSSLPYYWYKMYQNYSNLCEIKQALDVGLVKASHEPLSLNEVVGIFILFAIGLVVSGFSLFLERLVFEKKEQKKRQRVHWRNSILFLL